MKSCYPVALFRNIYFYRAQFLAKMFRTHIDYNSRKNEYGALLSAIYKDNMCLLDKTQTCNDLPLNF